MSSKILVIGSKGMLGSALVKKLNAQHADFVCSTFPDTVDNCYKTDITDKQQLDCLFNAVKPKIVFNCSAYTDVDKSETDTETAFNVNAAAVGDIALHCEKINARLVHISTDYVFDGQGRFPYKTTDKTNPKTVYGKSKLEGEKLIVDSGCRFVIVRTSWLFGSKGKNFVDTILKIALEKNEIKVVDDQIGCPTYTVDLAEFMAEAANSDKTGIFHFSNTPACSWFDFASEIVKLAGFNCKVLPCGTKDFPRPAPRPEYSVMDISDSQKLLGKPIRSWQEALKDYISLKITK